ncbi:MAG TPA: transglycosylase domain-containing protein, partial [Sphingomonas sp.]|nr:transglycosylase domain-containing protein [Sphingomonas sp.]
MSRASDLWQRARTLWARIEAPTHRAWWTGPRIAIAAILSLGALYGVADYATRPPLLPGHGEAVAAWKPSEAWLYDREGRLLDSARVDFQARRLAWVPLDKVAPAAVEALVAAEDKRFRDHDGIDWWSVAGSVRDRIERRRARGASTLSMQVAAYLTPGLAAPGSRGLLDKLRQMRAGAALERGWSKDQILEAYLNLAGFRGEAQGIGAAALGLFGKTPEALTRDDGLLLAALLPNPAAGAGEVSRRACALFRASESRDADCSRFAGAAASMLGPARSLALDPGLAPHLSNRLLTQPGLRVETTIDTRIQRIAIRALRRQLQGLGGTR